MLGLWSQIGQIRIYLHKLPPAFPRPFKINFKILSKITFKGNPNAIWAFAQNNKGVGWGGVEVDPGQTLRRLEEKERETEKDILRNIEEIINELNSKPTKTHCMNDKLVWGNNTNGFLVLVQEEKLKSLFLFICTSIDSRFSTLNICYLTF